MNVGSRIKALRKEKKLKLKHLSALAGISISFLSDIENGKSNPSLERLEKIAEKLGTSVSWLMGEEGAVNEASGAYHADRLNQSLQRLMLYPEFEVIIDCLEDFPDWDQKDREELIGYLKAKKLFRKGQKKEITESVKG
jgi:transcriptional regulator with XRE-family HTH domain